jgi:hypothetical protein
LKMQSDDRKYYKTELLQEIQDPSWAWKGGAIAKNARKALEAKTGKSVVTGENFLPPQKSKPAKETRDKKKKRKGT